MNTKKCEHANGTATTYNAMAKATFERCSRCGDLLKIDGKKVPVATTTVDVSVIKEYGLTQKLSNSVRVY